MEFQLSSLFCTKVQLLRCLKVWPKNSTKSWHKAYWNLHIADAATFFYANYVMMTALKNSLCVWHNNNRASCFYPTKTFEKFCTYSIGPNFSNIFVHIWGNATTSYTYVFILKFMYCPLMYKTPSVFCTLCWYVIILYQKRKWRWKNRKILENLQMFV